MPIRLFQGPVAALLMTFSAALLAAPPAPQPTVGANGVKQLRFDWSPVSGATGYELWFQASAVAQPARFFQLPASQTSAINNISVHLLNWPDARYWVNACDSSGCTSSNKLAVDALMLDTIGSFRTPTQQTASQFGYATTLSSDGTTLATAAPNEATTDPRQPKGSAYIYKKSGARWLYHGTVAFDVARDGQTSGVHLSLNANGTVLAVALPADRPYGTAYGAGSVKVFRYIAQQGWQSEATISFQVPNGNYGAFSASDAELDDAGTTLALNTALGGVYIYTYNGAGTWSHTGTAPGGTYTWQVALSGDGKVLAFNAFTPGPSGTDADSWLQVFAGPDWTLRQRFPIAVDTNKNPLALSRTGDAIAIGNTREGYSNVEVRRWTNGAYQLEATLAPQNGYRDYPDYFGTAAAFSGDGKLLAVGDPGDPATGAAAIFPPYTLANHAIGAVAIYERPNGSWRLRRLVKPGRAGAAYETGSFGRNFGFGDNGKVLAVGQPAANNNAGVVWLY